MAQGTPSVQPDVPAEARQSPRVRWGTISRHQIVDAALDALAATGFEQLTIRSLASRLGVSPMALYRHIRDKDDLLDEVVDELLRRSWGPSSAPRAPADWRAWVENAADSLRRLLVQEPAALHVYLRHPVVSPAAMARMETIIGVLRKVGFEPAAADEAYAAIHTYTVGFAALEASRARSQAASSVDARPSDGMAARLATYPTRQQFLQGLRYLLEGIEHHAELHAPAPNG